MAVELPVALSALRVLAAIASVLHYLANAASVLGKPTVVLYLDWPFGELRLDGAWLFLYPVMLLVLVCVAAVDWRALRPSTSTRPSAGRHRPCDIAFCAMAWVILYTQVNAVRKAHSPSSEDSSSVHVLVTVGLFAAVLADVMLEDRAPGHNGGSATRAV